ncbi:unnamed protein product, partial [Mesorhabditis spiculigera]
MSRLSRVWQRLRFATLTDRSARFLWNGWVGFIFGALLGYLLTANRSPLYYSALRDEPRYWMKEHPKTDAPVSKGKPCPTIAPQIEHHAKEENVEVGWPRVFCLINTMPGARSRAKARAINATWARHCDGHAFMTPFVDPVAEAGISPFWELKFGNATHDTRNYIWIWDRIRLAIRRVHAELLNDYDWFLKTDDDTFFVIENLKDRLKGHDPDAPFSLGALLINMEKVYPSNFTYASGGSGYIMSRGAIKAFVSVMDDGTKCRNTTYFHEDTEVGWCLKKRRRYPAGSCRRDRKAHDAANRRGRHRGPGKLDKCCRSCLGHPGILPKTKRGPRMLQQTPDLHPPHTKGAALHVLLFHNRTIHTTDKETAFEKMCADRTEVARARAVVELEAMLHYWLEDRIEKLACAEKKADVGITPVSPCQLLAGLPYETIAQYLDTDIVDLNEIAKLKWETTIPDAKKALAAAETRLFEASRMFDSLMQRAREIAHADTASTKTLRELCLDEAGFMPSNGVLLLGPLQDPSGPVSTLRVASDDSFTMIPPDADTSISTVWSTSSSSASTTLFSDSEMGEQAAEADRLDGPHEGTPCRGS